ncbi:SMC-Scp complex subunit ScpB [Thiohalophilus sp.]|uniref:SMC-Scp complex subunit ScpB n=1 Tax=Thiohalophilus sp. TaxID=3028392 RepID=UPI002ACDB9FA|nr:SMC-Scp complex subunit ScpB [Thiohalophilus sp.]MDZ7804667.1 SMC-Scp complex subunit ScpB [Thiohalophilus sp.]
MTEQELKRIIESVLFAADDPVNLNQLQEVFNDDNAPDLEAIKAALAALQEDYADHSLELRQVGSGYRFQVKQDYANWVSKLWEEKPARYSRAVLETLALIAYRQPITRGEIEEIRGVSVSTQIIKTLQEREWVKVVGHRDVPGKPALYASTREFLDYFNLQSLQDLPPLAELRDIDSINAELDWGESQQGEDASQMQNAPDEPLEAEHPDEVAAINDADDEAAGHDADETIGHEADDVETDTEVEIEAEVEAQGESDAGDEPEETDNDESRTTRVLSAEH